MTRRIEIPMNGERHSFENLPNDYAQWSARIESVERVEQLKKAASTLGFYAVREVAEQGDELQMGRFTSRVIDAIASDGYEKVGPGQKGIYVGANVDAITDYVSTKPGKFSADMHIEMINLHRGTLDVVADQIAENEAINSYLLNRNQKTT